MAVVSGQVKWSCSICCFSLRRTNEMFRFRFSDQQTIFWRRDQRIKTKKCETAAGNKEPLVA